MKTNFTTPRGASWMVRSGLASVLLMAAACAESTSEAPDSGTAQIEDSGVTTHADAAVTNPFDASIALDSGVDPQQPTQLIHVFSPSGHDRLLGVAFDSAGNTLAAGFASTGTTSRSDSSILVAKFLSNGQLDSTFGDNGVVVMNLTAGGNGELARGIVVQSTGKIVVSGTLEHAGATDARDRDVFAARFLPDGTLDDTFGAQGIAIFDLSDGEASGMGFTADNTWGLNVLGDDDLLLVGAQKAEGRTDSDFSVVRLDADGNLRDNFADQGIFTLDINQQGASPRTATVLADGTIVVTGYTSANGVVSPVLFKLTALGALDPSFGVNGVFNQVVLQAVTEAYGAVQQGNKFVTAGYGRDNTSESLDWVSLRLTEAGQLDPTYGSAGMARFDLAGFNDNARGLMLLPDNRIVLFGGGRTTAENVDAMVAILTPEGVLQGDLRSFDLGGETDFFWAGAMSPDGERIVFVGVKGALADSGRNDDAALFIMPTSMVTP